jgi:DNA-binding HxlR family transcriptional regulator
MDEHRSGCPINLTLEALGDRWSLIVIRDIMFGNRRHFRELMTLSNEGIASNVLADRLKRLLGAGLSSKTDNPAHKQKAFCSLTKAAINLVPLLVQMGHGDGVTCRPRRSCRSAPSFSKRGGPPMWEAFMAELRSLHLGAPAPERSVLAELRAAFAAAVARGDAMV